MYPSPHLPCGQGPPHAASGCWCALVGNSTNACCCWHVGLGTPLGRPCRLHSHSDRQGILHRPAPQWWLWCGVSKSRTCLDAVLHVQAWLQSPLHAPPTGTCPAAPCPPFDTPSLVGQHRSPSYIGTPAHCAAVLAAGCGCSTLQSPSSPSLPACLQTQKRSMHARAACLSGAAGTHAAGPATRLPSAQGRGVRRGRHLSPLTQCSTRMPICRHARCTMTLVCGKRWGPACWSRRCCGTKAGTPVHAACFGIAA